VENEPWVPSETDEPEVRLPAAPAPEVDEPEVRLPAAPAPEVDEPVVDPPFSDRLRADAAKAPGGWVYEVDPTFTETGPVPAERISRAWQVDSTGSPTSHCVVNPHYRPGPPGGSRRGRMQRRRLAAMSVLILGAVAIAVLLVLLVFDKPRHRSARSSATATTAAAAIRQQSASAPVPTPAISGPSRSPAPVATHRRRPKSKPTDVRLGVTATAPVWVCLEDQTAHRLINGQIMAAGEASHLYLGTAFRIFLGNSAVRLRINGRERAIPASPNPVGYRVSPRRLTALPAGSQPPCV